MNYEEIGKQAVKAGYDGGGIWTIKTILPGVTKTGLPRVAKKWRNLENDNDYVYLWPDFSYPETEGAALTWIAEKQGCVNCLLSKYLNGFGLFYEDGQGDTRIELTKRMSTKAECILAAIKSLNLGKKDNSPMGLNKRLLAVGFREKDCVWLTQNHGKYPIFCYDMILDSFVPDGSHPSTIGVATAWLRSFEKIGNSFLIAYNKDTKKWVPFYEDSAISTLKPWFVSELEALVEFAEWAKEEGLMS